VRKAKVLRPSRRLSNPNDSPEFRNVTRQIQRDTRRGRFLAASGRGAADLSSAWPGEQRRRAALYITLQAGQRTPNLISPTVSETKALAAQVIEQCLSFFQIGSIEAFGEPVVDGGEHRAGLVTAALFRKHLRKADSGAQLP
jgi:hypothetical protein